MAMNPDVIRDSFMKLGLRGDKETGLLRNFGVILANNSVDFLVGRELDFIEKMGSSAKEIVEGVLIDAAQWCANATFGGIMASPEWAQLIAPNVKTVEDKLDGLIAITNCLGWGKIDSYKLDKETQQLSLIVKESYYVEPYKNRLGKADHGICYMWTGVAAGYMDLLFGKKVNDFKAKEVKCGAKGDQYCEFIATPEKKGFGYL